MIWPQIASIVAVSVTLPLILRYLGKRYPPKEGWMPSEEQFSTAEVNRWNLIAIPIYIILSGFCGWVVWFFLKRINDFFRSVDEHVLIQVGVPSVTLALPAMTGGLAIGAVLIGALGRMLLKDRYELYELASSRQFGGMDSKKIMKPFLFVFLLIVVGGSVILIRTEILVFKDRIESCGPISCKTYLVSEIIEIGQSHHAIAPNGKRVASRDLYIRFKDGSFWSPFLLRGDPLQNKVAETLSFLTSLPVKQVDQRPEN
ncbi:MAG: hypothetical protein IPJ84_14080 [Bdellovibrionales bacterium]|nr:hypothetical protein [Bdellovibrionales bacterium]